MPTTRSDAATWIRLASTRGRRAVALIAAACALSACASTPRDSTGLPDDFWISVTEMIPTTPDRVDGPRPARFVIEADGVLRASVGQGVSDETFPPMLRPLTPEQVRSVHVALVQSGLPDRASELGVARAPTPAEAGERHWIVLSYRLNQRRQTLAIDADQRPEEAAKARAVVDRLGALAWIGPPAR